MYVQSTCIAWRISIYSYVTNHLHAMSHLGSRPSVRNAWLKSIVNLRKRHKRDMLPISLVAILVALRASTEAALTTGDQQLSLDVHNQYRSAEGAANMLQMVRGLWLCSLAYFITSLYLINKNIYCLFASIGMGPETCKCSPDVCPAVYLSTQCCSLDAVRNGQPRSHVRRRKSIRDHGQRVGRSYR